MDYSEALLGRYQARRLQEKADSYVLVIGSDRFTRKDLAAVECFNFMAAANLSAIIKEHFAAKHTRDVFDNVAPADLAVPRLGSVSLAVLGAAFQAKGLGGASPLESWAKKHISGNGHITTFDTLKEHHKAAVPARSKRKAR